MQNKVAAVPVENVDDMGDGQATSIDLLAILRAVLRRWKLVTSITLAAFITTYGILKLTPPRYTSTVEILVYDPQGQIDATVEKPISPFVEAVGSDAMSTEINILKSKSVALRVASELGLDMDPEFQPQGRISGLMEQIADLVERLGFPRLTRVFDDSRKIIGGTEEKAEKVDRAADTLLRGLEVWQESYIIFVSITSRTPVKAQRLASTIANDFLASQREARQEALEHVATWLKGRVDDLQSQVLETESSIAKLKAESGIRDTEFDNVREQQIAGLNTQLMTAREEVSDKLARFEQARQVTDTDGDIDGIVAARSPELTASAALAELHRKQVELNLQLADLKNRYRLDEHNEQIMSVRAAQAAITKQMDAEAAHILGIMKNGYDIAVRREQSLEANLQSLAAGRNSEAYIKLEELRRAADADRKAYESYLSQYNDITERRELQQASARIISPATFPTPAGHMKVYAAGATAGLCGGFLLAFLLEYIRPGVKTGTEVEQSFGLPVVGIIPLVRGRKTRSTAYCQQLDTTVKEPLSQLSAAVHALRIRLELSSANPKVVLITSALPGEGKSTTAMLLAASSASSGKRTILLDCDFRERSTSEALRMLGTKHRSGLSELLRGTAKLEDVISEDPITTIHVIPAGSMAPNAADLLMSQRMLDLIAALRSGFDSIVLDAPPLLPVVDALALATVADKILVMVEWRHTPHASIHEAFRVLRPEANRIAGIVLNKVDLNEVPGYGGSRRYPATVQLFSNA